jgi:WD40 repeat protein
MEELHAMPFFQISQETEGPGVPLSSRSLDVGTDPGWYENSSFDTDSSNDLYDDTTPESPQLANERRERNFPAWDRSDRESIEKRREDWAWTLGLRPQWTDPWLRIGSYWSSRLVMISSLQANGAPTHKVRNKLQANMRQSDCFGIQSLAVNSSESILASGNRRGEVCLWDLRQHPPKITTRLVNELKGRAHQLGKTQTKGMFGPISQIQFSAPISQLEFLERERTGIACDGLLNLWDVEMGCVVSSMNSGVLQTDRNEIGQFLDSWIGLSQPTTKDPFLAFSLVRSGNCMGSDSSCSQEILAVTQSNLFRIDMRCGQRSIQSPLLCSVTKEITMPNSMWLSRSWMLNSPEISPRGLGGDSAPSSNTQSPADYHFSCISPADFCDWVCVGSLSGHVHCFERRAGRLLHCWKAHEKAIIAIKSISNHQVLTIGRDRKATLWDLRGDSPVKLQRFRGEFQETNILRNVAQVYQKSDTNRSLIVSLDLPGGGSGLSMQNVAVQNFVHKGIKSQGSPIGNSSDNPLSMLYTVSGNRSISVPIPDIATPQKSVKLKAKSLRHASGAKKKSFRKLDIRSIALLPLRQLVLLGDDDGTIHVCV